MNITSSGIYRNLSVPNSVLKPPYNVVVAWFVSGLSISAISGMLSFLLTIVISLSPQLRTGAGSIIIFTLFVNSIFNTFVQPLYLLEVFLAQTNRTVDIHCPTYMLIRMTLIFAEYWSSLCLAINRLIAIVFPHRYKDFTRRSVIGSAMFITILGPFSINMPTLFHSVFESGKFPPLMACTKRPMSELLGIVYSTIGVYFPLAVLGIVYIAMALYVKLHKIAEKGRKMARRVMMARMLFISYFMNLLCFIPLAVMGNLYQFILFRDAELLLWLVMVQLLGFAATPVVFLATNEDYSNGVATLFGKCRRVRKCQFPRTLARVTSIGPQPNAALTTHKPPQKS